MTTPLLRHLTLALCGVLMATSHAHAQLADALQARVEGPAPNGIPAGGPYVPPGSLYDNQQSDGSTSLASQNSSGTVTARTADDFRLTATCASGQFEISQIRVQMVQADAAPQPFALDLYADNGSGTAPVSGINPIQTYAQTAQTLFGAFGAGTSIFEARFDTPGLVLDANTTYWLSGYGATGSANAAAFNNFFAVSVGAAGTTANGVIIAPGSGVADWTPVQAVIGGNPLAFSFAIDGTCANPVSLSVAPASATEGTGTGNTLTFTVTATPAPAAPVTVDYATSNGTAQAGSDYTATNGTLNFAAGVATQTVNVALVGDSLPEPNETLVLTLSNPTGGATLGTASATGTIINDDAAIPLPSNNLLGLLGLLGITGIVGALMLRRR